VFAGAKEHLHELRRVGADRLGPANDPFWCPLEVLLAGKRHMICKGGVSAPCIVPSMGSDASTLEEDLDGGLRSTDIDLFVDETVGDAVVVFAELDMVIDTDTRFLPHCELVGVFRKRSESWLIQQLEELAAGATKMLYRPFVQRIKEFRDGGLPPRNWTAQ